jgi:predicted site-specific integrase-resolvase
MSMKLSQYAQQQGISYKTALRWWKAGTIKGYQAASGTIIVTENEQIQKSGKVAIYARVSTASHKANLERQAERLAQYCEARGYQVAKVVKEIASGLNDSRPKLVSLLKDMSITRIVVEHKDRLTRFGFNYIETLFEAQGRTIEVVNVAENDKEDLLADL